MLNSSKFVRLHFSVLRLLAISLCGIFVYSVYLNSESRAIEIARRCYLHNGKNPNGTGKAIIYFEDLLKSPKQPKYDRGVFFVETKCSDSGIAELSPRYACSIESAARANPHRDIFMVFASPVGMLQYEENWPITIKTLMAYPNVHFRNVQLKQLCMSTPLEEWIETTELFESSARYEHTSDIMRTLIVYRYGGTYMDLDFMMLQRLDVIERNWIAIQNADCLNGAVFDFRRNGIGHIILNEVLSSLAEDFRPKIWGYNGPIKFQRILEKICNVEIDSLTKVVDRDQCRGAKVYPPDRFYPLFGWESLQFFNPNATRYVLNKIQNLNIMGFHFWNSHSKKIENIRMGNGAAYDLIAKEYCPRTYAENDMF